MKCLSASLFCTRYQINSCWDIIQLLSSEASSRDSSPNRPSSPVMNNSRQITIHRAKKDYPGFTVLTIPVYIGSSNNYTLHHLGTVWLTFYIFVMFYDCPGLISYVKPPENMTPSRVLGQIQESIQSRGAKHGKITHSSGGLAKARYRSPWHVAHKTIGRR